jgi:hypothetical protein
MLRSLRFTNDSYLAWLCSLGISQGLKIWKKLDLLDVVAIWSMTSPLLPVFHGRGLNRVQRLEAKEKRQFLLFHTLLKKRVQINHHSLSRIQLG